MRVWMGLVEARNGPCAARCDRLELSADGPEDRAALSEVARLLAAGESAAAVLKRLAEAEARVENLEALVSAHQERIAQQAEALAHAAQRKGATGAP